MQITEINILFSPKYRKDNKKCILFILRNCHYIVAACLKNGLCIKYLCELVSVVL